MYSRAECKRLRRYLEAGSAGAEKCAEDVVTWMKRAKSAEGKLKTLRNKLPPKPETHRTGLYGHRGTLKLHTPDWNDGYLQCLKDVSESFGIPYEEGEPSV